MIMLILYDTWFCMMKVRMPGNKLQVLATLFGVCVWLLTSSELRFVDNAQTGWRGGEVGMFSVHTTITRGFTPFLV